MLILRFMKISIANLQRIICEELELEKTVELSDQEFAEAIVAAARKKSNMTGYAQAKWRMSANDQGRPIASVTFIPMTNVTSFSNVKH